MQLSFKSILLLDDVFLSCRRFLTCLLATILSFYFHLSILSGSFRRYKMTFLLFLVHFLNLYLIKSFKIQEQVIKMFLCCSLWSKFPRFHSKTIPLSAQIIFLDFLLTSNRSYLISSQEHWFVIICPGGRQYDISILFSHCFSSPFRETYSTNPILTILFNMTAEFFSPSHALLYLVYYFTTSSSQHILQFAYLIYFID